MREMRALSVLVLLVLLVLVASVVAQGGAAAEERRYLWPRRASAHEALAARLAPPAGFTRAPAAAGSFADWLRHLPLLPAGTPVRSYLGAVILPATHPALAAVVDLDLSKHDRQQCADTIIRLRGEYHASRGKPEAARFLWSGGKRFGYAEWRKGQRPVKQGRGWVFTRTASPGEGYRSYRAYLEYIFSWTGTMNLAGEPAPAAADVQAGDFFIQGGSPGHAVIILDLARGPGGALRALIGQGFMPAQDLHVLRGADGAWFPLKPPAPVETPLWRPFRWSDLRRFRY